MQDFIDELLKIDVKYKDYQKQIIDHLISQVFVSDDNTVVYFNIRGCKNIDKITIDDTTEAIEGNIKNVRQLTSPLHQKTKKSHTYATFLTFHPSLKVLFDLK